MRGMCGVWKWAGGLVLAAMVAGAEDGRGKLAADLLKAMGAERQAAQAMEQVKRSQEALLKAARMPPGQEAKTREMQERVQAVIAEEFSWAKWKDDYALFYATTFTEQELRDLLAFYRSPVGQTYVTKMPEIQSQAQSLVLQRMARVASRTREIMTEYTPRAPVVAPKPVPPATPAESQRD